VLNKLFSAPPPTPKPEKCDSKTGKFFFKPEKNKHPFRNRKIRRFKPEIVLVTGKFSSSIPQPKN
jgi:uracil-DNA glycosylase